MLQLVFFSLFYATLRCDGNGCGIVGGRNVEKLRKAFVELVRLERVPHWVDETFRR